MSDFGASARSQLMQYLLTASIFLRGICYFLISLFLAISFISYDSFSPSFNVASAYDTIGTGSLIGSYLSDLLYQIFGISSLLLPIVFFLAGWYSIKNKSKPRWKNFFYAMAYIFTLSLVASYMQKGGIIGFIFQKLIAALSGKIYAIVLSITIAMFITLNIVIIRNQTINLCKKIIFYVVNKYKNRNIISETIEQQDIDNTNKTIKKIRNNKRVAPETPPHSAISLPSLDFLRPPHMQKGPFSPEYYLDQAKILLGILNDFGVSGEILSYSTGPLVTLYEFQPAPGVKSSRIIGLADDIARSMRAVSTRIAVVPGKNAIGIELPNKNRETVVLKELLTCSEFANADMFLPLVIGKSISGEPIIADLAAMPHLLIAGTTGSGKSVAINAMILSLLYKHRPEECRFIMIDPKMLELSVYDDIPHLLVPVVTDAKKAIAALKWVVKEMENRYQLISSVGARNIAGYNEKLANAISKNESLERCAQVGFNEFGDPIIEKIKIDMKPMPFIVLIVDEMADLMLVAGKDVEISVQRLSQMARAAGIHIILATQRPSVDVITGVIKANFPTRISFAVTSKIDSRTIINEQGAEQLLRMGDMLFMRGGTRIIRAHAPLVLDDEVQYVVNYLKSTGRPNYVYSITEEVAEHDVDDADGGGSDDELYQQAIDIVRKNNKISTSYIQRQLRIGYNRSAILVERMEREGIVSPPNHSGKREIL